MSKENAILDVDVLDEEAFESFDFDDFERKLEGELTSQLSDLEFLNEAKDTIGNPNNLGETVMNVVWDQVMNQIAATAGEDFVKENGGLYLDLSNDAHIQTAENFANGKIAKHNSYSRDQLENNYERYKNTSHKEFRKDHVNPGMNKTLERAGTLNKEGVQTVTDAYSGEQIPTENGLPNSAERDHVNASSQIYKDPSLQMSSTDEELAATINHEDNLVYTAHNTNKDKSDKNISDMPADEVTPEMVEAKRKSDEMLEQKRQEGEERLKKEGQKTQREEAFRITGKALRAMVMRLLAELVKEIFGKLVSWLKSASKSIETLITYIKSAISSFIGKLKIHLVNAGSAALSTVAQAILGPVVGTIRKTITLLKQGWRSLKEAIDYLKSPESKAQPIGLTMLHVGKIITTGLSGVGAIVLGEVIEKGLMTVPFMAFPIPILGSLANIVGIFMGAVVSGIIGAIALNLIDKLIAKQQEAENVAQQVDKGNEILNTQHQIRVFNEVKFNHEKNRCSNEIEVRHAMANTAIAESMAAITTNCVVDNSIRTTLDDINQLFDELLEEPT